MKLRAINLRKIFIIVFAVLFVCTASTAVALMSGCSSDDKYADYLQLYLSFDEGSGNIAHDSSGNLPDAEINYVFTNALYKESEDPQWRDSGVVNGSLLFDGYSQYIRYDYSDYKVSQSSLTISCYVAPRVFEWDDPDAKENGTDNLTTIVSQCYKADNMGFVLGYWRYGELSFQVGLGDRWISIWSGDAKLSKYEWNYVVAQFDGENGEMRLYLNGELVAQETFFEGAQIARAVDEYLYIGRNNYPTTNSTAAEGMVSGMLDEIKIYNTILDETYIQEYYETNGLPEIEYSDITLQNILTDDIYKTQYHGGPYQNWMNEPHAPIYYKGVYHLFFQLNITGPYWKQICWGHLTSTDMVNWTPQPEIITPMEDSVVPDGVWSGGSTYDSNGVPVIFFTAGNDSYYKTSDLISNQNCGYAFPADPDDPYLKDWIVGEELAIKQEAGQGRTGEFRDMHVWQEDGIWYMVVGSGSSTSSGGTALLFTSDTLTVDYSTNSAEMNWIYRGELYTMENQSATYGTSWELPVLLPISNEAGTITKYIFIISPAPASTADNKIYYFLGTFDKTTYKFIPDEGFETPHIFDYGSNVFTGPSAFINPTDGEIYLFSVMQDYRSTQQVADSGWANCAGLARRIWLNDDGTDVCIEATDNLDNYATELVSGSNLSLDGANALLADVDEDMLRIDITFKNISATAFGINVKTGNSGTDNTVYTYDVASSTITGATLNKGSTCASASTSGSLALNADGTLTMQIYIDRSLVEAFFNDAKALSIRSYADYDSTGISVFAEGGEVEIVSLSVSRMQSIYL